jgi:hypothetical protein
MIKVGPRNVKATHELDLLGLNKSIARGETFKRDDVYVDNVMVRQDYPVTSTEGQSLLIELQAAYTDYENWFSNRYNLLGSYGGYREPYQNSSLSFYKFASFAPPELQKKFGCFYPRNNLKSWYGLKFDLTQTDVMLKCVINRVNFEVPELPVPAWFFATTHRQDETMSDWVDAFISATPQAVKEFCTRKGLAYPIPDDVDADSRTYKWCYGFVFNKSTLEYGAVKGYARYMG